MNRPQRRYRGKSGATLQLLRRSRPLALSDITRKEEVAV